MRSRLHTKFDEACERDYLAEGSEIINSETLSKPSEGIDDHDRGHDWRWLDI